MRTDLAVFLATSGHSGVDRLAHHLIPALAQQGYTIDVLKIHGHGPVLENIPEGVRIIQLDTRHVYSSLPALTRYLQQEKPRSMLCDKDRVNHTALLAKTLSRSSTYLALRMGTTVSVDLAKRSFWQRNITRWSIGKCYRYADGVLVVSEGVADDLALYTGFPRDRLSVLASPIVPKLYFTEPFPLPDHPWFHEAKEPIILGLGELSARKDFSTLIRAFSKVRAVYPSRLIIAGRGRQHEALLQLAYELGVADSVSLPGFITRPFEYLAYSQLFVLTSRWEGMPFALIEALAVGTPVVSTDCPSGPREVLKNGKYGMLVPTGDEEALANAMIATLRCPLPKNILQEAAQPYEVNAAARAYAMALSLDSERN